MADSFHNQISAIFSEYETHTVNEIKSIVDSVAAEAVSKLHSAYPGGSGEYNMGWRSKPKGDDVEYGRVIYGGVPTFRLAHLLEFGHATRNGGRTAAVAHIKPIEVWAAAELERRLKAKL